MSYLSVTLNYTMQNITAFSPQIPANKFNPPRLAANRILIRSALLEKHLGDPHSYQFIILEAQAGQGKTTTAIQFLSHINTPYVWYQISKEDCDPLYFISALLEGVQRSVPGFSCPLLALLLQNAELTPGDIGRAVNLILDDMKQFVAGELTFVFDDLHLIEDAKQSMEIVDYMLETAPDFISFILISRRPLSLSSRRLRYGSSTLYLDNDDLAFSNEETGALLEILQDSPADPRTVSALCIQTGGWVMGVSLAACSHTKRDTAPVIPVQDAYDGHLLTYFEEELFDRLNKDRRKTLIKLALLDDIVVELARDITGRQDIGNTLLQLMDENCFIRSLDDEATQFSIHHLFRSLLRKKARELLSPAQRKEILLKAAMYSQQNNMLAQCLNYLLRAEAFSRLEEQLSRRGMELVFMNRLQTLASVLEKVPLEHIRNSAWFSYFSAFVTQKTDPVQSLELFLQARQLFQDSGHSLGELVVLGELIYYHIVLSPDYNRCKDYLHSASLLFEQFGSELPSFCQANTAKNLSAGCFYFLNDFPKALDYARIAETEAVKTGSPSQLLEILATHGFIHMYHGELTHVEAVAERIYETMTGNDCGLRGLIAGMHFLLQLLHYKGDYQGYDRLKTDVLQKLDQKILNGTIVQPFIVLYNISIASAEGELDQALAMVNDNVDSDFFLSVSHLRNEMLATKALILSQMGLFEPEGREIAETLLPVTMENITPGNRLKLLIPLALSFAVSGNLSLARELTDKEIEIAHEQNIALFEAYGRLLRAFIATLDNNMRTARFDLQQGLEKLRREGITHIRCFSQTELLAVLKLAIQLEISQDFARRLAAEHLGMAIQDNGTDIPLLSITTLGSFKLYIHGHPAGRATDFTTTQRQLLGLLISHPQLQISQEQAQYILWPDPPPDKGRNRFDALLSRLRKILSSILQNHPVKNYLALEKGILSLQNCKIDARQFSDSVQQGLTLVKDQKWWQAENSLNYALDLWTGPFVADLLPGEHSSDYGWELQSQLTKLGLSLCPKIAQNGQLEKSILIASRIWKENPADEQLTSLLYNLYLLNKEPMQAKNLYKRYEKMLKKEEYPEEEMQELLERLSIFDDQQIL